MRSLVSGVVAGTVAATALRLLRQRPPGGVPRWARTSHAGASVTLLEGPAYAAGAATGAVLLGAGPGPVVAAAAAAGLGALDDLAGDSSSKGLRGHLSALARGEVTTGAVKIAGLGLTGLLAAAAIDRRGEDRPGLLATLVGGAVVAGAANVANLLDLRPGRALKATTLAALPLAASPTPAGVTAAAAAGAALGSL